MMGDDGESSRMDLWMVMKGPMMPSRPMTMTEPLVLVEDELAKLLMTLLGGGCRT